MLSAFPRHFSYFLLYFRWLLFYWIGVVLVDLCKGLSKPIELCITIGKEHGYIRSVVEKMSVEMSRKNLAD
ncbi:hypothetical protein CRYPA_285 [uncultured Candidatus Thioglobus sp.]|nr:hypothetical protein CRYPA_285 [uncultured Candidatus Thioglobus sp.]